MKETFELGFVEYQNGAFNKALSSFKKSSKYELGVEASLTPSSLYISRCEHLINNPPNEWSGVWSLTEK